MISKREKSIMRKLFSEHSYAEEKQDAL